jgi:hypothetical protein
MLRAVAAATGLVGAAAHRLTRATTHAPVDGITDVHAWSGYGPPIDDKEVRVAQRRPALPSAGISQPAGRARGPSELRSPQLATVANIVGFGIFALIVLFHYVQGAQEVIVNGY